jgi:hypothetical protein
VHAAVVPEDIAAVGRKKTTTIRPSSIRASRATPSPRRPRNGKTAAMALGARGLAQLSPGSEWSQPYHLDLDG